jgi:hypothetical protein
MKTPDENKMLPYPVANPITEGRYFCPDCGCTDKLRWEPDRTRCRCIHCGAPMMPTREIEALRVD